MELTLLGTGCPVVDTLRYGPAQVVRHGDQGDGAALLVDCGSGVTQRLLAAGVPGRDLDAVLLSHLHSDHIVDLFQLVISSWHQGRDRPQRVFGPPGTRTYVEGLMALWRPELEQRVAHERRPSTAALEVEVTEVAPGEILTFGGLEVTVIEVDHRPVRHAYGFLFEAAGRRLALSGDTRRCPALIAAARGADLLVHEVFVHRELPVSRTLPPTTRSPARSARSPPRPGSAPWRSLTSCRRPATAGRCSPRSRPTSRAR
jgi:ribonuclease Z